MKNILLYIILGLILVCVFINNSFKNSYKYVRYQNYVCLRNADVRYVDKYYDFPAIILAQAPNADENTRKEMEKDLKSRIEESYFEPVPYFQGKSIFNLYLTVLLNRKLEKSSYLKINKIDKDTVQETTDFFQDYYQTQTIKRVGNNWKIVAIEVTDRDRNSEK